MPHIKTTISCQCPKEVKDRFNFLYPYCLSRFLINCVKLAVSDKNFFDKVYFDRSSCEVSV